MCTCVNCAGLVSELANIPRWNNLSVCACVYVCVCVCCAGLVSELANIPHWVNLALHTPEPGKDAPTPDVWPLSRALSMVPSTYRTVRLWAQQELDQELEAFVLGAPSSRTAGNPLVIELNTADEYEDSDGSLMSRKVAALSRRVQVPYVSLRPFPLCW